MGLGPWTAWEGLAEAVGLVMNEVMTVTEELTAEMALDTKLSSSGNESTFALPAALIAFATAAKLAEFTPVMPNA